MLTISKCFHNVGFMVISNMIVSHHWKRMLTVAEVKSCHYSAALKAFNFLFFFNVLLMMIKYELLKAKAVAHRDNTVQTLLTCF